MTVGARMRGRAAFGRESAAVWRPGPDVLARSRLARAMRRWGYSSLADLHRDSVDKPEWFWRAALDDLSITLVQPATAVVDASAGHEFPRWFPGGKLNIASHCVDRHAADPSSRDRTAVIYEGDSGARRSITFGELGLEVNRIARGLVALGIRKGDRVALFLPVIPEAAVALLACAKIGAVAVPAFSGYGPDPLASRLNASEASVLVTVDGTTRRGKRVPMKDVADAALAQAPSVKHVLVIKHDGSDVALTAGRDLRWEELGARSDEIIETLPCDPNDPFMIIYTSGTTGAPKGIVHSHLGYLLKPAIDFGYAFDIQADDRVGWIADMGWMLGPLMIVGALQFGAGIVFVEGLPDYPDASRMWRIVERNKITLLGLAPTAARGLKATSGGAAPSQDLSSLRAFASTGEAWDEPTWRWLFETVGGSRLPILNYTGGTETGGGILSCYTITPQAPASFSGPLLGMDVDVLDQDGARTDGVGELVIHNTWPGMTHGFWRDPGRYLAAYWDRWPGVWVHGDLASVDADGYWHIHGRSDDTIKVAGRRIGPAEIESALVTVPVVAEAAVIGVPDAAKGQRIVAFVTLIGGAGEIDQSEAGGVVARLVGKAMVPSEIIVVPGLPKTKNGKIMRRAIRSRYLGEPSGDMSALDALTPLDLIPVQVDLKSES